ncbi:glycosyltransferase [Vibrio cholerae]|uniref:glycosyltransferase n=1 Tax=Vibrio cholerae TaxID=666 RepID=UPI0011D4642C|nr:glycosyltransferase [Vibrio cholerae]TXY73111.1 glycosyltransferase [Vibrio cholerae]BCN21966.1 putative glycosyltransferase [Vibrio cholerae]GIB45606.1 glycosyl transferase 2 family protein [Vibrio cholerae]
MCKVSVLIMVYNHCKFIEDCIESVLNQTFDGELEIIVGDDASSDTSAEVLLKKYASNANVSLILRRSNIGATRNFLDLLNRCSGDYIIHLDGDDYMLPGRIQKQLSIFESNPSVNVVHGNFHSVDENGKMIKQSVFKSGVKGELRDLFLACHSGIQSCTVMVRNPYISNWKDFFPVTSPIQDIIFIYKSLGNGRIAYLDEAIGAYRTHENSVTNTANHLKFERWTRRITQDLAPAELKRSLYTSLSASYVRSAIHSYRLGKSNISRRCIFMAFYYASKCRPSRHLLITYLHQIIKALNKK